MRDWCIEVDGVGKSHASAALCIIQRQGLGKVRHIDCSYLCIPGARNPADMCTKGLAWEKIFEFVSNVGGQFAERRAGLASKLP